MPLTNNVIIDQARALDLLDQLRVAVPEEVRQAKRINEETERIVERAQEEAERILARAQEQAAFLIEERELTRAAEIRSAADHRRRPARGRRDPARRGRVRRRACWCKLEGECVKALQSIRRGLALLDERHPTTEGNGVGADAAPDGSPSRSARMLSYNVARCFARRPARRGRYPVDAVAT